MLVYHCTPDYIHEFEFNYGVHFGGIISALEAGIRKHQKIAHKIFTECIYLHICKLDVDSQFVEEVEDIADGWHTKLSSGKVYKYINKYEPDINPSWYVYKDNCIVITEVIEYQIDEAKELLESYLNEIENYHGNFN